MRGVIPYFLILLSMLSLPAQASSEFSFSDLKSLIQNQKITSIESLLPLLPESFRSHYALIYNSMSLQSSTQTNPRALMLTSDGSFICTFNGDPSEQHFDDLECMQYEAAGKNFSLFNVTFPSSRNDLKSPYFSKNSNREGQSCLACHGEDPRPNWDPYSNWPKVYGSVDDSPTDQEASSLTTFLKNAETHPRYRWLKDLRAQFASSSSTPDGAPNPQFTVPHNAFVTEVTSLLNSERLSRIIQRTPNYSKRKFAILWALICSARNSNEYDNSWLPQFLPESLTAHAPQIGAVDTFINGPRKNLLYWLFESENIDTSRWTTQFIPGSTQTGPFVTPIEFGGQSIALALAKADSELMPYLVLSKDPYGIREYPSPPQVSAKSCSALGAQSIDALGK